LKPTTKTKKCQVIQGLVVSYLSTNDVLNFLWPSMTTFFERTLCYAFGKKKPGDSNKQSDLFGMVKNGENVTPYNWQNE